MIDLQGRVALVTGAASGIGAATATLFARAGADVALGWFPGDPHDVAPVRAAVEAAGRRALAVPVDVTSAREVDGLVERTVAELGRVDVVVANAGINRRVPAAELDDAGWAQVLDVNLAGAFRCFRAAIPHMRRHRYGRLLATSSVAGTVHAWAEQPHYAASKAGVAGLVRALAVELGPDGITANAVAPGVVETPQLLDPVNSLGPDRIARVARGVPVRRIGRPEDIAYLFLFLACEHAGYISGQLIVADGARRLTDDLD
jgi:3-oxoacyl-[acyl-carrier protein] reductase